MQYPLTKKGSEILQAHLRTLKTVKRREIIKAIEEARAHGDLKENAEYHAAKENQSFLETEISKLEMVLSHANIIDVSQLPQDGKVVFGATLMLTSLDDDQSISFQIVGNEESDMNQNKVSYASPMARAVIGKYEGDEVEVKSPSGVKEYAITSVQYIP